MRIKQAAYLAILLLLGGALAACGAGTVGAPLLTSPTETPTEVLPTLAPTPTPSSGPVITLTPPGGGARSHVSVLGRGFPAGAHLAIHLSVPDAPESQDAYAEAIADPTGTFRVEFIVPAEWPDGTAISESELIVVAEGEDQSAKAEARFAYGSSTSGPTTAANAAGTATPSSVDEQVAQNASDVVNGFLTALEKDPSGQTSVRYLDNELKTKVQKGQKVAMLLGIQNMFPSYTLDSVEPGEEDNSVLVHVTLQYTQPQQRVFLLTNSGGNWKITDIALE